MFRLRHVCALLSQTLVPGAILKGGQDTTRARKIPENKCEGFLHGSLARVGMIRRVIQVAQITLPIHPDNPHLTTTTRHVMVGITRSKVFFFSGVPMWCFIHTLMMPIPVLEMFMAYKDMSMMGSVPDLFFTMGREF